MNDHPAATIRDAIATAIMTTIMLIVALAVCHGIRLI